MSEEEKSTESTDAEETKEEEEREKVFIQCRRRTPKKKQLNPCGSNTARLEELKNNVYRYECEECGAVWTVSHHSEIDL